jgi:putative endopeptidase
MVQTKRYKKQKHQKTIKHHRHQITEKDDFYTFINKKWLNHHKYVPENRSSTNAFVLLQEKVDNEMRDILFKKVFKETTPTTPTARRTKHLFESMSHWDNALAEKHLDQCIFQLNQYRREGKMYEMFAWFMKAGFSLPFHFYIMPDIKNNKKFLPYIEEGGLSFQNKDFYFGHSYSSRENRKKYYAFLKTFFSQAVVSGSCFNPEKVVAIEEKLAKYIYDKKQPVEKLYNKYGETTLKTRFHFDFPKLAKLLGFHRTPKKVVIENTRYFENVMHLLNKSWASEEWYDYWVYQILIVVSRYQSELYETCFKFFNSFTYGITKPPSLVKIGISKVEQIMNTEMNKKYLEYYKNTDEIEFTKKIVERIRFSFRDSLLKNNWLSQRTLDRFLLKLDTMQIVVGSKTKWQSDPGCDFVSDDGFANFEMYMAWKMKEMIRTFYLGVPETSVCIRGSDQDAFDVNASYTNTKNELLLPNALLQPPFVDLKKSMAYNMANIGSIIGHEIMHAFDEDGCKYNENGEYENWWLPEDLKKYEAKQREIVKHYELMAKHDKIRIDSKIKLSENLADIGGFLNAEKTFIEYLIESGYTGTNYDRELKSFYTFYAKEWRTINKPKFVSFLLKDSHSLAKYRVNSVLSLSPHFHRVFGIETGHKLYSELKEPLL